jgi:hypothetical protein
MFIDAGPLDVKPVMRARDGFGAHLPAYVQAADVLAFLKRQVAKGHLRPGRDVAVCLRQASSFLNTLVGENRIGVECPTRSQLSAAADTLEHLRGVQEMGVAGLRKAMVLVAAWLRHEAASKAWLE